MAEAARQPSDLPQLPKRPGPSIRAQVTEHTAEGSRRRQDRLATEEPLEIRIASSGIPGRRVWVTMRTPGHDFDLAAGFCVHEGITRPGASTGIHRVAYCTDSDLSAEQEFNVVTVTVDHASAATALARTERHPAHSAGSSACGVCGKDSIDEALTVPLGEATDQPRATRAEPDYDLVRRLPQLLREQQSLFARTGGVHGAALMDASGEVLVVREDVGRHNAVDKVTGARVLAGESPGAPYLVVSGRAGFELVQKAVTAGVGCMVAVGAPSSLAVGLAQQAKLVLIGFAGPDRCVRYC